MAFRKGHFSKNLLPAKADLAWPALSKTIRNHLKFQPPNPAEAWSYNSLQRLSYLAIIFIIFPLMIWTGLAMSPGFTAAFPITVEIFGGQQSARTIHFFLTVALTLFVLVHIAMVFLAGFKIRMRAMITGQASAPQGNQ